MYLWYNSIGSTAFCPLFSGLRILNLTKINPTTTTPCQSETTVIKKTIQKIQTLLLKETAFALSKKPLGNPTITSTARLKVQNTLLLTQKKTRYWFLRFVEKNRIKSASCRAIGPTQIQISYTFTTNKTIQKQCCTAEPVGANYD